MKKAIVLSLFTFGVSAYGFSSQQLQITTQTNKNKEVKEEKKKIERYDISLFKFVLPQKSVEQNDSTRVSEQSDSQALPKDATTFHQEKPRDFFMFS